MKRPLAYVTAAWRGDACEVTLPEKYSVISTLPEKVLAVSI